MAEHTPGPWEVKHRHVDAGPMDDELSGLGWEFVDDKGPEMPILRGLFSKAADAHLIAAAPDLLEALEWALPFLPHPKKPGLSRAYIEKMEQAQAAIRKARGGA